MVTHCIVELYNLWFGFSRNLYLSTAFAARDGSGKRIELASIATAGSVDEALTHAIRRTKPNTHKKGSPPWRWADEPSWGRTKILLDSLDEIGASNCQIVSNGLSTLTPVFAHLPRFRHFYAHRNEDTARGLEGILMNYGIAPDMHASVSLMQAANIRGVQRPQPLLLDWIDDVTNVISLVV